MPIPPQIIDNSEGNTLVSFLNLVLKENPNANLDIATAFFNIHQFGKFIGFDAIIRIKIFSIPSQNAAVIPKMEIE